MTTTLPTPPIIDDATRREFLALLGAAGLLTGCGEGGDAESPAAAPSPATRRIEHALGVTDVPVAPNRVLPLDQNELEEVVALGFEPVGTIPDRLPYLPDVAYRAPTVLTDAYEVELEKVVAASPDVIVGPIFNIKPIKAKLDTVAPTVVARPGDITRWKDNLRFTARVLGRQPEAEKLLADYDAAVTGAREEIGPARITSLTVTVCLPFDDQIYIYVDSFANTVLTDLGLRVPDAQRAKLPAGSERIETSLENTALLDADVIFRGSLAASPSEVDQNPLWARLPAVAAGRVVGIDGQTWNQGSVLAARRVLDDILAAFRPGGPAAGSG